jgi:hypothetical protein
MQKLELTEQLEDEGENTGGYRFSEEKIAETFTKRSY